MKWGLLIPVILPNAVASVLIKRDMTAPFSFPALSDRVSALKNWPFWRVMILYGVTCLLYAAALHRFPLNVVHPVMTSGTIALVAIMVAVFFRESTPLSSIAGIGLVMVGVVCITLKESG
jgi:Membrane transporters of cations and cationic drugs